MNCKHCACAHSAKVLFPFLSFASIYNANNVHNNMFVLMLDPCFKSFDYMKAIVGKVKVIKMIAEHDVQHNFDALFAVYFLILQSWYCWHVQMPTFTKADSIFKTMDALHVILRNNLSLSYHFHVKLKDYKLSTPHLLEDL